MKPRIEIPQNQIITFCEKWDVRELYLFGSVLREDFRPDSDVDVLISMYPNPGMGLWEMEDMRVELEGIFGREVDMVEVEALRNPIRRKAILSSRQLIYSDPNARKISFVDAGYLHRLQPGKWSAEGRLGDTARWPVRQLMMAIMLRVVLIAVAVSMLQLLAHWVFIVVFWTGIYLIGLLDQSFRDQLHLRFKGLRNKLQSPHPGPLPPGEGTGLGTNT